MLHPVVAGQLDNPLVRHVGLGHHQLSDVLLQMVQGHICKGQQVWRSAAKRRLFKAFTSVSWMRFRPYVGQRFLPVAPQGCTTQLALWDNEAHLVSWLKRIWRPPTNKVGNSAMPPTTQSKTMALMAKNQEVPGSLGHWSVLPKSKENCYFCISTPNFKTTILVHSFHQALEVLRTCVDFYSGHLSKDLRCDCIQKHRIQRLDTPALISATDTSLIIPHAAT